MTVYTNCRFVIIIKKMYTQINIHNSVNAFFTSIHVDYGIRAGFVVWCRSTLKCSTTELYYFAPLLHLPYTPGSDLLVETVLTQQ